MRCLVRRAISKAVWEARMQAEPAQMAYEAGTTAMTAMKKKPDMWVGSMLIV